MLSKEIKGSREYKRYLESKGVELIEKLKDSMYSGAETKLIKTFLFLESAELIEKSPYLYLKTDLIGKANKELRYG